MASPARRAGAEARAGGRRSARAAVARPGLPARCLLAASRGGRAPLLPSLLPPRPLFPALPRPQLASLSAGSVSGRAGSRRRAAGGAVPAASRRHGDAARPMGGGGVGWAPWPRPRAAAAGHVRGAIFTPAVWEGSSGQRCPDALPRDCTLG